MFNKPYSKSFQACQIFLKLPAEVKAGAAYTVGEHNPWDVNRNAACNFPREDALVEACAN